MNSTISSSAADRPAASSRAASAKIRKSTVALLEAGGPGDSWVVKTPFAGALMVPTSLNNWAFETIPQKGLDGRRGYQPRGKALGGSSAINAMVYIRGTAGDYDLGREQGARGWSWADVLPYFIKSEANEDFAGPLAWRGRPAQCGAFANGQPLPRDLPRGRAPGAIFRCATISTATSQEGCGIYQVTQKNGERWSAARAYLHPHHGAARQSAGRMRRAGAAHPVRRPPRGWRRIRAGRNCAHPSRAPRGDRQRRRPAVPANPDAVRHRHRQTTLRRLRDRTGSTTCRASGRTCRTIPISCLAIPRAASISPALRRAAARAWCGKSRAIAASGAA